MADQTGTTGATDLMNLYQARRMAQSPDQEHGSTPGISDDAILDEQDMSMAESPVDNSENNSEGGVSVTSSDEPVPQGDDDIAEDSSDINNSDISSDDGSTEDDAETDENWEPENTFDSDRGEDGFDEEDCDMEGESTTERYDDDSDADRGKTKKATKATDQKGNSKRIKKVSRNHAIWGLNGKMHGLALLAVAGRQKFTMKKDCAESRLQ
jgi:hypothetical protein